MTDILMVIDRKGRFARIDARAAEHVYAGGEDFTGESLTGIYAPDTAAFILKNVRISLKSHKAVNVEYNIADDSGERWFAAAISPMTHDLALCVARDITELKAIQGRLEARTVKLEEINATLNILADKMSEEARGVEGTMLSNIMTFVLPHVANLKKTRLSDVQTAYVELIETNLSKLASPLIHDMRQFNLTPMEIQVTNLIKDGRTTREIAGLLHTSKVAIDNHRYNIRKKLGLNKKKWNIRSFLLSVK